MKPTPEQLAKLPKWAQDCIGKLERERSEAVRALNQYCDSQTVSPFSILHLECIGEQKGPSFKTQYIQGNTLEVRHCGVWLRVYLADTAIQLQYAAKETGGNDAAMIPDSYQSCRLVTKENMR